MRHPLEDEFNASAWDILSAISKGFRARVDVRGRLADYFLDKEMERLKSAGTIQDYVCQDKDGEPDFLVKYKGRTVRLECKNVRSKELFKDPPAYKVEIQKTRNAIGGGPTRGYRIDQFDILAACLFNHTREWKYLFSVTKNLKRREDARDYLVIMQPVPISPQPPWYDSLEAALDESSANKR